MQCAKVNGKRTNKDLHNSKQKTKDRATRTTLKIGGELRCCRMVSSFCFTCCFLRVTLVTGPVIGHVPSICVSVTI
jgi:hypothetical protein